MQNATDLSFISGWRQQNCGIGSGWDNKKLTCITKAWIKWKGGWLKKSGLPSNAPWQRRGWGWDLVQQRWCHWRGWRLGRRAGTTRKARAQAPLSCQISDCWAAVRRSQTDREATPFVCDSFLMSQRTECSSRASGLKKQLKTKKKPWDSWDVFEK